MEKISFVDAIWRGLLNECPCCRAQGAVFRSLVKMNEDCPKCGYHFEREPGYFLGAMSIGYSMGFVVVLPIFLFLLFTELPLWVVVGVPALPVIAMAPFTFRFSRLIYMHLDYRMDPHSRDPNMTKSKTE